VYRKLSLGRKRELLATLAAETFEKGELFFAQEDLEKRIVAYLRTLPPADVDEDIDGEAVLKAIEARHGILVERAHRIHAFAHLSFQEYFTAKYVVENNALARLLTVEHIRDRRWREVILQTASLLYNADAFFEHFYRALNDSVREDTKLLALLQWVDAKACPFAGDYKISAMREAYIYFALALDFASILDLDFDLDLVLELDLDHGLDHARDRACDRVNDLDLALDLARALTRIRARGLDLAHARKRARILSRARTRVYTSVSLPRLRVDACLVDAIYFTKIFRLANKYRGYVTKRIPTFVAYLQEVVVLAQQAGVPALAEALATIHIPDSNAPRRAWDTFALALNGALVHRDLHHKFVLSDAQVIKLEDYLEATQLLVECLALARVSDRAGIEARILQPPEG